MIPRLFIGFEISTTLQRALTQTNAHQLSFFTQGGNYLESLVVEKRHYLGKYCPIPLNFDALENLEIHVRSLLQQLIPSEALKKEKSIYLIDRSPFEVQLTEIGNQ